MPSVSLSGFEELKRKMERLPRMLQEEINEEVKESGRHWESLAKNAAPVDQGRLRNEIRSFIIEPMTAEVVVNVDYAPYVEFGTKSKVRVPAALSSYAAQFKGAGNGGSPKRFIFAWCKRVGIQEKYWYAVYLSIMVKGIKAQPFFFVQQPIIQKEFIRNIKNVLNSID